MGKRGNGEGSIYKQREGLYAAYITGPDGKRRYFYGKTKTSVREKLNKALLDKQRGTLVVKSHQLFGQYLLEWLEYHVRPILRARTYERYEEIARIHVIPQLGKIKLQDLKPQHIRALLAKKLDQGLSTSTVSIIHRVIHKSLDDAMRSDIVAHNVCDVVRSPRERRKEVKALTPAQARKLLETAKGHPLEAVFVLALTTGMRRGELFGLKWQDIDLNRGVLQVRRILSRVPTKVRGESREVFAEAETKTEQSRRSIVLTPIALDALVKHRVSQNKQRQAVEAAWQDNDYVFCGPDGRCLNPNHVSSIQFKALLEAAGLPNIRFHDLRHSAATLLLSQHVHPKVVQEILGHSKISMTMDIYSHVLPTMQEDAMNKLGALFEEDEDDKKGDEG